MTLPEISIRRPVFAWMLMLGLLVFGALSFQRLGVSQLPDIDFPVVSISLSLPGAAPGVMETQVVDLIEDAVMDIQGIRSVESSSRQGSASVSVEFELDRKIDVAVQEIQTRLAQVQRQLPNQLDPPVIRKRNPEDQPILWLTLTCDSGIPLDRQMMYARNVLFDQFTMLEGVGDVALGGYVDPNLRIWLSAPELSRYQLTANDIVSAISSEHVELPAGRIENDKKEFNVRLMGEALTPEEFGKIIVNLRGGGANYTPVPLSKVARIEEGLADVRRISRLNGKTAVGLGIIKQHGANSVEVAARARKKAEELIATLPPGFHLEVRMDSTTFIQQSVDELNFTLILSAALTSLVCFLFLGSLSSTVNVLMAIPTSIVGTFIALHFFGFTLNVFTLLGLSLAIGIVVDDAIMMLENIVRHAEKGEPRRIAALNGSKEIAFAALASTIAVVAIFLPVVFMKGVIGRYLAQYGITVTVAVLLSLVEALTLTPMRCSRFLRVTNLPGGRVDRFLYFLSMKYRSLLSFVLERPVTTVALSLVFFAVTVMVGRNLPTEMMPPQDQSRILLRLKAPIGSAIDFTDKAFRKAEGILAKVPEVESVYASVGGFGGDAVNEGIIFVGLKDPKERAASQREVMDRLRTLISDELKGIKVIAQDMSQRGFASSRGFPVEFTVQGPDWDRLGELSQEMVTDMEATKLFVDTNTDFKVGMPEVQVLPNRQKAAMRGVALHSIGENVNALVGGAILNANTRYPKERHRYDIRVRLEGNERSKAEDLNALKVRNNRGELIPLKEVVSINQRPSLQIISRRNRERAISVFSNIAVGHSQEEALKAVEKMGKEKLPSDYHIVLTGSAQSFRESLQSLFFALALGILVSYMVLASQFDSFVHPVSILMALPFSVSGAFLALLATGQSLNLLSVIGLILLMGIVKKNSILLVDFTNQMRREGLSPKDALLSACPVRLRPILMTSVATVAGALPVALAIGPGSETRTPMAVAIIGGVILSTILTLAVVPCVYLCLTRIEKT